MASLIQVLLLLGSGFVASVLGQEAYGVIQGVQTQSVAECALHGGAAVDELLDSAVYIWAATGRCGQPSDGLKCEIDIASAIESMNAMANKILKAAAACGAFQGQQCALTVGHLTKALAGAAAASGGIIDECPALANATKKDEHKEDKRRRLSSDPTPAPAQNATVNTTVVHAGKCILDMKDSFRSLFSVISRTMSLKQNCATAGPTCVHNSLQMVAAVSSFGEYLSESVGYCTVGAQVQAECAGESLSLIHALGSIATAGHTMSQVCKPSGQQALFLAEDPVVASNTTLQCVAMVLVALIPIASVLSFFAGSRMSKKKRSGESTARELESLQEDLEVVSLQEDVEQ